MKYYEGRTWVTPRQASYHAKVAAQQEMGPDFCQSTYVTRDVSL